MEIIQIPTGKIDVVPGRNPRLIFSPAHIEFIGRSLLSDGQEEAIMVLRNGERFELIHGENRLRAALLKGIRTLEAKVYDALTDPEIICKSLKPNFMHRPLGFWEVALKVKELKDISGWSHERVGRSLGWSQKWATDRIRIAEKISPQVRQSVSTSSLNFEQVRLLARLPLEEQDGAVVEILRSRMTGKQTALYITQLLGGRQSVSPNPTRLISESKHLISLLHIITDLCDNNSASFSEGNLKEIGEIYSLLIRLLGKVGAIVHRSDALRENGERKGFSEDIPGTGTAAVDNIHEKGGEPQ